MARARRRFGWLFYGTIVLAVVVLAGIPLFPFAWQTWEARRLSRQLRDPSPALRGQAATALKQLGRSASPWVVGALTDPNPQVRIAACQVLLYTDLDRPDVTVPPLIAALSDSQPAVRRAAAYELQTAVPTLCSPHADPTLLERTVRGLAAAMRGPADAAITAAYSLGQFGRFAQSAIGSLHGALEGPNRSLRIAAADSLLKIDRIHTRARVIATMRALLADRSLPERFRVMHILVQELGEDGLATMLNELLNGRDIAVRSQAFYDLTVYCPHAKSFIPTLVDLLDGRDRGQRCNAALYLLSHEPTLAARALETLVEQITDPSDGTYFSAHLVDHIRKASPGSIDHIVEAILEPLASSRSPSARLNMISALEAVGPEAKPAVPVLLEIAQSGQEWVASGALVALIKIEPQSLATRLPLLLDFIKPGRETGLRLAAIECLSTLGPKAKPAVSSLLPIVDEDDIRTSAAALDALGHIDPEKAKALRHAIRHDAAATERAADAPP
jgi:HEAT repeat protein